MKNKDEIYRAIEGIFLEIETYGKYRERKGSGIYDRATYFLNKFHVIVQGSRTTSTYWYPGKNYSEARSVGPANYIKSRRKEGLMLPKLKFENRVFSGFIWFLLGTVLGGGLTWVALCG